MEQSQLRKLQQLELDILKAFVKICDEENLRYFAVGGTALGAVRHNGFIPWDDDIDVAMPREDYERFLNIGQSKLPEGFFLQHFRTDPNCPFHFAKIRNSNTTFVEMSCKGIEMNHGVYIDIFPLDSFPESKLKQKLAFLRKDLFNIRMSGFFYKSQASLKVKLLGVLLSCVYPDYRKQIINNDKYYKKISNKKTDYIINYFGVYGIKEATHIDILGEGKNLRFEDIIIRLPANYDKFLTGLYGDYMKLPPEDEREGHHHTAGFDLEHSYLEILN